MRNTIQIQERRKQVSALTRDGIEVIPNISVMFRVDTGFPKKVNQVPALAIEQVSERKTGKTKKRIKRRSVKRSWGKGSIPMPKLVRLVTA